MPMGLIAEPNNNVQLYLKKLYTLIVFVFLLTKSKHNTKVFLYREVFQYTNWFMCRAI